MRHDLRNFTIIPEIDLSTFDARAGTRSLFLDHLRTLAHEGFFYLAGQRINPHLLRRLMDLTRRFLALPYEEKMAIKLPRRLVGRERDAGNPLFQNVGQNYLKERV